ncbi:MFS transporter [Streptomyces profundus]|uniref:MFS transporter n=1 Tax=Streptomyces profundus TaxID=2867410 RepID=UPI001D1676C3|nr:MFS transporter [Streptomyces sp. MA3_2.13]UED88100.1 MFS transporter [Streptomyces sp. MA3_2.13]
MGQAGGLRSYTEILRVRGAGAFLAASVVGRLPMSTLGLSVVLLVTHVTDSYATAGVVSAAGALAYAVVVPRVGRAVDRRGQRRVLRPLAFCFALAGVALVLAAWLDGSFAVLLATGAVFGATMPPLSALVRARWSHLLRADGGGRLLVSAYSLESVVDELIFVTGPLLVAAVVLVHPAFGVVVVAGCGLVGSLALAAQRATEPPATPRPSAAGSALALPGMRALCLVWVATAAMFAAWELSTMAFVDAYGSPWMIGAVLATYALGSAVGGLWYGARSFTAPVDRRLLWALVIVVAGMAPLWAMPSVVALWAFSLVSGLLIAPTVIAAYSLVREGVPDAALTESMAWMSTAVGLGRALGLLVAGLVVEAHGPRWGYAFTLGCGLLALAFALPRAATFRAMARARPRAV